MRLTEALSPVVDAVFPPRCPLCGDAIAVQQGLCAECFADIEVPGEPCCSLCQRPFEIPQPDGSICGPCLQSPPRHDGIAAATLYGEGARKLILALKHGGRIALAPMMAGMIARQAPQVDAAWLVAPVPLHRWRIWRRGYNQAGLLARGVAEARGAELSVDVLRRTKSTPMLGGLGRAARRRALSGAIQVAPKRRAALKGRDVLLVDDVLTSGATSDACVSALKRAGAAQVMIGCFARVVDRS